MGPLCRAVTVTLHAPAEVTQWPMRNLFTARLTTDPPLSCAFGIAGAGLYRLLGVYYDAVPAENDPRQKRLRFQHHFVSLDRDYLPEPDVDVDGLYRAFSRTIGRPAIVPSYEYEVDPSRVVGLAGPYCAYLARTIVCPDDREAWIIVGNTDGYRLYLNGERIAEVDEHIRWAPFNNDHRIRLRKGANHLLVKLIKRGSDFRFTLAIRDETGHKLGWGGSDWTVDLADGVES